MAEGSSCQNLFAFFQLCGKLKVSLLETIRIGVCIGLNRCSFYVTHNYRIKPSSSSRARYMIHVYSLQFVPMQNLMYSGWETLNSPLEAFSVRFLYGGILLVEFNVVKRGFFFLQIYLQNTCKKVTQIAEANTSVKPCTCNYK